MRCCPSYVTAAGLKDDTLRVALDLTAEWDKVADTQLITGVTVVRKLTPRSTRTW